ncbi:hypothetical protein [Nitratidesulfovibrio termitidis]|uniref:hypothetical protein n=1 Tax=Nitratidesulfovibrio termitidis TaxID=42252 RepID=UPI00041A7320|nr:hypothetical protein [Nitratidesulfovibrio termitidis]
MPSATRQAVTHAAALVGDAFCDHSGGTSAMRIMAMLVCVIVLGAWIVGMLAAGRYIPLGWAEAGLIGGACGAKAAQSRFELGGNGVWGSPATGGDCAPPLAPRDSAAAVGEPASRTDGDSSDESGGY